MRSPPGPLDLQSWVPGLVSRGSFSEETQPPGPQPGCRPPRTAPGTKDKRVLTAGCGGNALGEERDGPPLGPVFEKLLVSL